MLLRTRLCAKCGLPTGMQPDGSFIEYTLHTYVPEASEHESLAVFCATCFDRLETTWGRTAAAMRQRQRASSRIELH